MFKVISERTKIKCADRVRVADSELARIIGLMFKKEMVGFDGLLIERCNSIHTFFMRYPIDVVFLDKKNTIVKIIRSVVPWRITLPRFKARKVLELQGGSLPISIIEGDVLEFICTN